VKVRQSAWVKDLAYLCAVLLQTHNLHYRYPGASPIRFPDVAVEAGTALLITGESGCGKTTLLHLLAGLLTPQQGSVLLGGKALERMAAAERDRWRGRQIGLVFQQPHFVRSLTVRENWMAAAWCAGLPVERSVLDELADRLELRHVLDRPPHTLSAGEKQRASIARAMVNQPALLLADEPTSALDDRRCAQVVELLKREASAASAALIIVTHDARVREHFARELALAPPSMEHLNPPSAAHLNPPSMEHLTPPSAAHLNPPSMEHLTPPSAAHLNPPSMEHLTPPSAAHLNPPSMEHLTPPSAAHLNPPSMEHLNPPSAAT